MIITDALEGYWLERRRDVSENTVKQYQYYFDYLVEYLGDVDIEAITSDNVHHWLNWLGDERQLATKTVANAWVALSAFFTWAEKELDVEHPIRDSVACPKIPAPTIEYYTQTEVLALSKCCDHASAWRNRAGTLTRAARPTSERDRAIIATLLDTGLRATELCSLKIKDYDRDSGRVIVRKGKGKKFRVVYLGQSARRLIWKYMSTRQDRSSDAALFSTTKGGRENHLDKSALRKTIQKIGKQAGVTGVTLHRFRHTFAINFLRNGGTPLELKELLGHSKLETVMIYVRLAEVDLARAQQVASPADNWGL